MGRDTFRQEPGKQQPAHEVRLGSVKAAVWANQTEGGVRYNVTFERLYREGETWRSTTSFGRDDLLLVAKVADLAHTWICNPIKTEAPTAAAPKRGRTTAPRGKDLGDLDPPARPDNAA
ncbi:MAG TPA: hypothetical protein PKE47_01525 [Verrucomicrobiota bacterium]|nr:hypothetical protein [Verrucomicrobiota bacterium]